MEKQFKREIPGRELRRFLTSLGLPEKYARSSLDEQQHQRVTSLRSWFDPFKIQELVCDTEAYVKAHRLWTEYYLKPENVAGTYFYDDPLDKYDMLREVMSPSLFPDMMSPAKSIVRATRRKGKTQTIIVEAMSLMAVVRPFTTSLISEFNAGRTREEIGKIQYIIENTEAIHHDFGGRGVLWPKRGSSLRWSSSCLQFLHHKAEILGFSLGSAQRGRGPNFGVIDDPEGEENSYNKEWRTWFFEKLLNAYVRMFNSGGKVCWIGTPIHEGSCLSLAMRGVSEKEGMESAIEDPRFKDWRKLVYPTIKLENGKYISMQPQSISAEAFEKQLEMDPVSARKEILCEPITPGVRAFNFDPMQHGYMQCLGPTGEEYFLDLKSGKTCPWKEWIKCLYVVAAGDIADGASADSDPGAVVFVGADPDSTVYVLDCYVAVCMHEQMIEMAYAIADDWYTSRLGWEKVALQTIVNRIAKRYVESLREAGKIPPVFCEIENIVQRKEARILSMSPLFSHKEIRFRWFSPVTTPDGKVHQPAPYNRKVCYLELLSQVMEYTDQGLRRHDDAIDALEMAVRLLGRSVGQDVPKVVNCTPERYEKMMEKAGLPIRLPHQYWSEEMHHKRNPIVAEDDEEAMPYV